MINHTCEQSNISSSPQCSHRFILQFRLICQSIVNLQNSFFGVIYICLKFCSLDKLCIVVFFNSTKSFLKPFNHLTILTIFSDYANFLACFCIFCMRWCFHFIPLFVRDQMLSSWKGQCFYHQYILCTCLSSIHYLGLNRTTLCSTNPFLNFHVFDTCTVALGIHLKEHFYGESYRM